MSTPYRASLYQPMRADQLPDLVLPLRVVEQGYRVVYRPAAICREYALGGQRDEFRMRVRVSLRAMHALFEMAHLLSLRYGLFAFQLLVHKMLRYILVVPLVAAFFLNSMLAGRPLYGILFGLQCAAYALAGIGWATGGRVRFAPVFVPFYFCLINFAAGAALMRFLRGERQVLWTPRKGN